MSIRALVLGVLVLVVAPVGAAGQQAPPPPAPVPPPQAPAPPPAPAAPAQPAPGSFVGPTFEVGLGYQYLRAGELCFDEADEICSSSQNFPLGFAVDGVRNYGRLGLVAEVGWSRDADDIIEGVDQATISQNIFHYVAGVRWTGHNPGRVWPYGQILAGAATVRADLDFDDDELDEEFGDSDTTTRFIIQPGIGVTVVGGDGWGVFGQVDYRRLFLDEDEDGNSGRNDVRVFGGLRVILD